MGIDWNDIAKQAVQAVMPYFLGLLVTGGAILMAYAGIVLNRLKAKLAASEAVDKDKLLKSAADQGVQKAKEMSAVQFQTTGVAMTGQQKQAIAISVVAAKAPDTTPADAKSTVIAAVGAASGEGASGKSQGSA